MNILVVEDEPELASALVCGLEEVRDRGTSRAASEPDSLLPWRCFLDFRDGCINCQVQEGHGEDRASHREVPPVLSDDLPVSNLD
jgi:hypothetical protein